MSDLNHFLKQRHRSRLASTVDRLNCRLRRVCSLLHEPNSVAAPPRLLVSVADVHESIDRRLRLQYARSLQELCAIHEQHRPGSALSMFLLRHRDLMRAAAVPPTTKLG